MSEIPGIRPGFGVPGCFNVSVLIRCKACRGRRGTVHLDIRADEGIPEIVRRACWTPLGGCACRARAPTTADLERVLRPRLGRLHRYKDARTPEPPNRREHLLTVDL